MNNPKEIYVDGVETIHLLNDTVRMDLFSLQPPPNGSETPSPQVFERLIMPVQAFLNMHGAMQQIINKMLQDGLLKNNPQQNNNWDTQK